MQKNAFTLAEVLITLVVVGVVAAITVPVLMNDKNTEEKRAKLLKAQTTVTNALGMFYTKNGVKITPEDVFDNKPMKDKIIPYIAIAKDCGQTYGTNKPKGCYTGNTAKNSYKTYNGSTNFAINLLDDGQFIMNDGVLVLIENPYASHSGDVYFTFDLNGFDAKPNRSGKDLFTFQLNKD